MNRLFFTLSALMLGVVLSSHVLSSEVIEAELMVIPVPASSEPEDEGLISPDSPHESIKRQRLAEEWQTKIETLSGLERIAVDNAGLPRLQNILPYRFNNASQLQSMLRDPQWATDWSKIATTIAVIADKKTALDLITFIKDSNAPAGYEWDWRRARLRAVRMLGNTLIDQDIPEVLVFLEALTDPEYIKTLNFGNTSVNRTVRYNAYYTLSIAQDKRAVAILEKRKTLLSAKNKEVEFQILSTDTPRDKELDKEIESIDAYLETAQELLTQTPPKNK